MNWRIAGLSLAVMLAGGSLMGDALAHQAKNDSNEKEQGEQERQVTEKKVPAAALEALKTLAGGAAFIGFAEEIEHGHKFYEGSWIGAHGNVDALVTPTGDIVEIEEIVPPGEVPPSARAATARAWGSDQALTWEKKTLIMYEAHFMKGSHEQEMLLTPDGRPIAEEGSATPKVTANRDDGDDDDDEVESDEDENEVEEY